MKHVVTELELKIIKECLRYRFVSAKKGGSTRLSIPDTGENFHRDALGNLMDQLRNGVVHQKNLFEVSDLKNTVDIGDRSGKHEIKDKKLSAIFDLIARSIDIVPTGLMKDITEFARARVSSKNPEANEKEIVKSIIEDFSTAAGEMALVANIISGALVEVR